VHLLLTWLNQREGRVHLRLVTPLILGLLLPFAGSAIRAMAQTKPPVSQRIINQAQFTYETTPGDIISGLSNTLSIKPNNSLTDPSGVVLGCGGQPLSDYTGFMVGIYETSPTDPTGSELGPLLKLTLTEFPDDITNNIPRGVVPNTTNQNPYKLSNVTNGRFSFLLDRSKGQLDIGKAYILVVKPPESSALYTERRIKIQILNIQKIDGDDVVTYRAISLDGLPIATSGATQFDQDVVLIENADELGLKLLALPLTNALCQQNQIQLTKSADRASAAPGDTVIYRLSVRNSSDGSLFKTAISDQLPVGFKFLPQSVRGELGQKPALIKVTQDGQTVTMSSDVTLQTGTVLNIAYAAQLTPDALRGTGTNYANIIGHRVDNNSEVKDGPAIHKVRLSSGLLSNCGTIIGRVFEDRNFDGEQQDGEPGIPNAVVYLEDGNRITTDPNGLFSVKCVLPGYHTGVLDPMSVPGYRLAPNRRFIEGNSASRLVRLAPGNMVRMNFAVIPTGNSEGTP
jgi:uncharacterized repeat protein (TIGR01451 family)